MHVVHAQSSYTFGLVVTSLSAPHGREQLKTFWDQHQSLRHVTGTALEAPIYRQEELTKAIMIQRKVIEEQSQFLRGAVEQVKEH
jgi:hypothetical protein